MKKASPRATSGKQDVERLAWLASFPERNPNPVVELDLAAGAVLYANPAAQQLFPDLVTAGANHPWVAGTQPLVDEMQRRGNTATRREVMIGQSCYQQGLGLVNDGQRIRIYGLEITERKQAEETLRKTNASLDLLTAELEKRVAEQTAAVREKSRFLEESELRYRSLVTAASQIIWTTNAQGEVVDDIPMWRTFTGQNFDEVRGTGWATALHPDDRERTKSVWQSSVATHSTYSVEYRLRRHDGVYRHVAVRGVPVLNAAGSLREWVGACTDITENKESQRRLDFTHALLGLFAQKSTAKDYLDAVVEVLRQWSGCQVLGIRVLDDHNELPYESSFGFEPDFLKLEHRLDLHRDNCCCTRAVTQSYEEQDRSLLTPGGSYRCDDSIAFLKGLPPAKQARYRGNCVKWGFASLAIVPIRYHEQIIGAIHLADRRAGRFQPATIEFLESISPLIGEAIRRFHAESELARYRDRLEELVAQRTAELEAANGHLQTEILHRNEAEAAVRHTAQELERSNRDLEQFAYVASHDLQEPLRAVGGYVKLLERRLPEQVDAKAREYIAAAAEGAARMQTLISDLLAFARVGTRGGTLARASLNDLLRDACDNLQTSIRVAQAKVTSDPLPALAVDAALIVQLFQNLIGNAVKFRREGPPAIHVSASEEPARWVISVRDNGIGIEAQYFQRIFQIFQRLHTRRQYPGTGMGLAICKKIVERHDGEIWLESQPGAGSTFYFSIPKPPLNELSHD
jgi:PAS domain S-box-containing protein